MATKIVTTTTLYDFAIKLASDVKDGWDLDRQQYPTYNGIGYTYRVNKLGSEVIPNHEPSKTVITSVLSDDEASKLHTHQTESNIAVNANKAQQKPKRSTQKELLDNIKKSHEENRL